MKLNIEELAKQAGIETKLWSMGAASLVYTEGCHGVARSEFEAVIRLIVERCAQECEQLPLPDGINLTGVMPSSAWETGTIDAAAAIRNLMED